MRMPQGVPEMKVSWRQLHMHLHMYTLVVLHYAGIICEEYFMTPATMFELA